MKNELTIFVGPSRSGKGTVMLDKKEYWELGGKCKVGIVNSLTRRGINFNAKFWSCTERFDILWFDDVRKKDLLRYLDEIKLHWEVLPKPIFMLTNDMPDFEKLKKYGNIRVFKFTPAEHVFPLDDKLELCDVFSLIGKYIKETCNEK